MGGSPSTDAAKAMKLQAQSFGQAPQAPVAALVYGPDTKAKSERDGRLRADLTGVHTYFWGNPTGKSGVPLKNSWIFLERSQSMILAWLRILELDSKFTKIKSFSCAFFDEKKVQKIKLEWTMPDPPLPSAVRSDSIVYATTFPPEKYSISLTAGSWRETEYATKIGGEEGKPYVEWIGHLLIVKELAPIVVSFLAFPSGADAPHPIEIALDPQPHDDPK